MEGVDPSLYQELRYRLVGPFRASRTVGGVGVPSQPGVFYVGVNNGGVWKTDDYGRTWHPIFDGAPTGSVGDVAVAPSNPDVIYLGSGEGLHRPDLGVGDGIFKSIDTGRTWRHVGLGDVQQVGRIVIHPRDPDVVFVAGMGHPYGANDERGVFRTADGGRSWTKVLFVDRNTGAGQVEIDPTNPAIVYATLWNHREAPWENGSFTGPNSGMYKSTDGGVTWHKLSGGLPDGAQGLGRINFAIAESDPRRIYALVPTRETRAVFRSDDAGATWQRVSTDQRLDVDIRVHPRNADVVFTAGTASYKSEDGGRTWTAFKGAPGGDDYQRIWIDPVHPDVMLFTADQGATITVNGGRTWSSWYNQPTAQLYHVTTDRQFPYWIYGGQQESGAIGIASRGNGGQISFRDWIGVGADEYAYIAPDPLNPDIVYGGRVVRFNKKTGQTQTVAPEALRSGRYRILRTMPLLFHPLDPTMLLFATNVLWKTTTGGRQWEIISPDLSREHPDIPESVGDFRTADLENMPRRGVIYAVAPSPKDAQVIWAGTDDGLMHVTRDGGKTWKNVTPPPLRAWDKVSQIDAGQTDVGAAYMSVNAIRRDDMRPHVYRTHDTGATWTEIVNGLPALGPVNVVREDPKQPGLLFAGTERQVYFSIDDGNRWQSLRLNMPASSVRDLVIHEDDLVVGTHGRSIWILDGISMLRELAQAARTERAFLFTPPRATRVRWNMFSDTPLPPDEPTGQNPPDGAILDYYLPTATTEVALDIVDGRGGSVRRYSSRDEPERIDPSTLPYPTYWLRPPQRLSTERGHHRFMWDLRYAAPVGARRDLSIAAIYHNTATSPVGPFVHPGRYTVRLTAGGVTVERPIDVRMDPRVAISDADLRLQTDLSLACYRAYQRAQEIREALDAAVNRQTDRREQRMALRGSGTPENPDVLYESISAVDPTEETIVGLQQKLLFMMNLLQAADARPTTQAADAVKRLTAMLPALEQRWAPLR
ncbi:MAG: glycoside hydrolase [Acidobacteria bacterium 13_1_40CM_3_65_5]|nr:MAG: glycoside hydrolase [Acidobacteria bacterium 13_1_40CM_3_65_5]